MVSKRLPKAAALFLIAGSTLVIFGSPSASAAPQDYRFELAGIPQPTDGGKSLVSVRLVRAKDSKAVTDAVVFEAKADMAPMGMPTMTAPTKTLPPKQPGVYQVEVEPGMTGTWALNLAAKVQGEAETVRGTITAELTK